MGVDFLIVNVIGRDENGDLIYDVVPNIRGNRIVQWSHSGFDYFRRNVAISVGIDLDYMEGYSKYARACKWENIHDDIVPLFKLNYFGNKECTSSDCKKLVPRLQMVIDRWAENSNKFNDRMSYDIEMATRLISRMKRAIELDKSVIMDS